MIEIEMLRKLLAYNPDTGSLIWMTRPHDMFPNDGRARQWNSCHAGKEAFTAITGGYRHGLVLRKSYRAHRVIWAMHYGEWPKDQIDHINGDRSDNRIANLRGVSNTENQKNAAIRRNNTSGVTGVSWDRATEKWVANITVDRLGVKLGYFSDFDAAVASRKLAEAEYGFHANHGRAAK